MKRAVTRVLFLSTVNPVSRDTGKKVVVNGLCAFLHRVAGHENFLLATTDDLEPAGEWRAVALPRPSILGKVAHVVGGSFLFSRRAIQESVFRSGALDRRIRQLVDEFQPTMVVLDTVRLGQYLPLLKGRCRTVLYLDDLFSVRYERMLAVMADGQARVPNPLGNFARHVPGFVRHLLEGNGPWLRYFLNLERGLVERSEREQAKAADISLLVNRDEVRTLKSKVPQADVRECPPALEVSAGVARNWNGAPNFVFLGSLNLPHNLSGIEQFLIAAFPEVLKRLPQATLCIVGRHAPQSLIDLAARFGASVTLAGFVPDVGQVLAGSCALIAPLLYGSGTKIKVIEALAAGIPLVSTPIGAEGIELVDGRHGFIVDGLERFPQALVKLVDSDFNRQCSAACSALYEREYSIDALHRKYSSMLDLEDVVTR